MGNGSQNYADYKDSYSFFQFKPEWLPFNKTAEELVDHYVELLNFPDTGPKADKYRACVASFLYTAQRTIETDRKTKLKNGHYKRSYLGVRYKPEAWSPYPMVGKDIAIKVAREFVRKLSLKLVEGSGSTNLTFDEEEGKYSTDPIMSLYVVQKRHFTPELRDARFIQVGLPFVKVNKPETRQQKYNRQAAKSIKPTLKMSVMRRTFGEALRAAEVAVEALDEFWRLHPIVLPSGHAGASAKRVFHDGRLDAGGRFYGLWTGQDKETSRLKSTIDGEPICELDIRASQPTLLSCLLGERLGGLQKGQEWSDVYGELSRLLMTHYEWTLHDDTIDVIALLVRNRKTAKSVIMEMIGQGDPRKKKASKDLKEKYGLTEVGWDTFRDRLVETVPALELLEPRYDDKGGLTGYINGAGFLSYHESEMMLQALLVLKDHDIPAYPVHDCLIVKTTDSRLAARTYREVIRQYCFKKSGLDVLVPLSVEVDPSVARDDLPPMTELIGRYLN